MSIGFDYKGKNVPVRTKKQTKAEDEGESVQERAARRRLAKIILEAEGKEMLYQLLEEYVYSFSHNPEYYYQRMEEIRLRYFHTFDVERKRDKEIQKQQWIEQHG